MRIGQLATHTGVPATTIRYYEELGVFAKPARTKAGYRDYPDDAPDRLQFVKVAQNAGLTLKDIRGIMAVREQGKAPCKHVAHLIGRKLGEVAEQMEALRLTKQELRRLAERANRLDPQQCDSDSICHIIDID